MFKKKWRARASRKFEKNSSTASTIITSLFIITITKSKKGRKQTKRETSDEDEKNEGRQEAWWANQIVDLKQHPKAGIESNPIQSNPIQFFFRKTNKQTNKTFTRSTQTKNLCKDDVSSSATPIRSSSSGCNILIIDPGRFVVSIFYNKTTGNKNETPDVTMDYAVY